MKIKLSLKNSQPRRLILVVNQPPVHLQRKRPRSAQIEIGRPYYTGVPKAQGSSWKWGRQKGYKSQEECVCSEIVFDGCGR